MKTSVICFPFDLFGSSGTGAGAQLLADELREVLADNRRETVPTRARAYSEHVRLRECEFQTVEELGSWRRQGRQIVRQVLRSGDFLIWLGGNHLAALPIYDELAQAPDSPLVVQFDAHLDIHNFRDTSTELSHGNFLLHVEGTLPRLVNVGHRDLLLTSEYIAKHFAHTFSATDLFRDDGPAIRELRRLGTSAGRIYLDIDCDVFDPVNFPAVGTPVPLGLPPALVVKVLDAVWSDRVAGVLLSEFHPAKDQDDRSLSLLVWLIEWLLLRRYESSSS